MPQHTDEEFTRGDRKGIVGPTITVESENLDENQRRPTRRRCDLDVAKVVPVVGVLIGAGVNSAVLGRVAAEGRRYCQTRFLCDKYGLPLPAALATDGDDASQPDVT
jgi:hypothetical protein